MEVLTRPPPHQDAPMDLSTTARRMLSRSSWTRHAQVECAVEPRAKTKPEVLNRYIPIPKKRHCHVSQPQGSPRRECQSPSPVRQSPPAKLRVRHSESPEMSRKRARMESPKPSDLCCASAVQLPLAAARNDVIPSSAKSPSTVVSASDSSREWPAVGAGLAGANGEVVVAGEGVTQSVMKPRQRGHPSSAESSYDRSPPSLREDNSEGMPPGHVFSALLQMQSAAMSQGMLPNALKDTEALLSAVHQSQMLYYSYCSQLIQTLRAKQIEQQTQQPQQHLHSHHDHQLNHYPPAHQQQQHQHQLHHHRRFHQEKQPRHHHERTPEQPRLSSEPESERHTPFEETRNYESEDTEEDFHTAEDDTLSILRTRLNSQVRRIVLVVGVHCASRGEATPPEPMYVRIFCRKVRDCGMCWPCYRAPPSAGVRCTGFPYVYYVPYRLTS
ncbi:hypothetical protein E2C01_010101 [Portunus trituberculatus]|uniref:Uncharacterized protein n=1 Tax=Portunus trituberculatus TaxID=210409 RepID=A0A5B7D7H0_PORTR|nr:hypothetical protein [Portunus trituberculatus]